MCLSKFDFVNFDGPRTRPCWESTCKINFSYLYLEKRKFRSDYKWSSDPKHAPIVFVEKSLALAAAGKNNADSDVMPWSPLAVNTDEMRVVTLPTLKYRGFDEWPDHMSLHNNGRTGKSCALALLSLDYCWALLSWWSR